MLLNEILTASGHDIAYCEPNGFYEKKSSVSFNNTLCQILISISSIVIDENVKINSDFSKLKSVNFKPIYLERILLNLILNSIKRRKPETPLVINISTYLEGSKPILEISDNGYGIDLATFKKNDIEGFQGNIYVESFANKGTFFKIYL